MVRDPQSLVGKHVLHCCKEDNTISWFEGEVVGIWQHKPDPVKTVYSIKYDESPEDEWHMPLLLDLSHGVSDSGGGGGGTYMSSTSMRRSRPPFSTI